MIYQVDSRDAKLGKAVKEFFEKEGDMFEFMHVLQSAINEIPINDIGVTTVVRGALRKNGCTTVGDVIGMSYGQIAAMPHVGNSIAGQLFEALAVFRRNSNDRPAQNNTADDEATAGT